MQLEVIRDHFLSGSIVYIKCYPWVKKAFPAKYAHLPAEGTVMKFAALYNRNCNNIKFVDDVLDHMEKTGGNYVMVCCRKKDVIYKALKWFSFTVTFQVFVFFLVNITN